VDLHYFDNSYSLSSLNNLIYYEGNVCNLVRSRNLFGLDHNGKLEAGKVVFQRLNFKTVDIRSTKTGKTIRIDHETIQSKLKRKQPSSIKWIMIFRLWRPMG
jgi:hypothetical protein